MRRLPRILVIAFLIGCATTRAAQASDDSARLDYNRGVADFQAGDYAAAREDFLQARHAGYTGPDLDYSLGASCFKLGRYDEARAEFARLTADPRLAGLAHYNLGLIAVRQGDRDTAARELQAATASATDPAIRRLAQDEMTRLPPPQKDTWFGYADLAVGYDDDVAPGAISSLTPPSRQGSPLASLLLGGGGPLTGTHDDGLTVAGSFYRTDYPRLSQYDETVLQAGPQYRYVTGPWTSTLALSGNYITLGGQGFDSSLLGRFEEQFQWSTSNALAGGLEYEHVDGLGSYAYLSGWRRSMFAEERLEQGNWELQLGIEHELNRREDLTTATEFSSASPTVNRFYARGKLKVTDRFALRAAVSHENSRYSRPDVLAIGGTTLDLQRDDDLDIASLSAVYGIARLWQVELEYRYLRNDSNIPIYGYQSHLITLSLGHVFF